MTMTPLEAETTEEPIIEIDLTDLTSRLELRHSQRFSEAHVVEWLRTSGGTLAEQLMKRRAAEALERYAAAAEAAAAAATA